VLDNTQSGSIILLHVMYDPQKKSLTAVKPIIEGLKQKGFRFVTVSELLESKQ
jgi:peptidoglycan-N-acetylglucosamine deacetylase